ncbi:MAG TPA: amidohydrolase family protein [Jatrophihabitantaceae bacterium]
MPDLTGRLVDTGRTVRLRIDDAVIAEIASTTSDTDLWLAPGLVDLQVNGYAGHDVNTDDVDAGVVADLVRSLWAAGVTSVCPTVVTGTEQRITRALRAVAEARAADPLVHHAIPRVHVEGPHIADADGPRGAHDIAQLRPPDVAEFRRWQQAGAGLVGVVTLAPELPGAVEYIAEISRAGVVAALGHTAAEPSDIAAAVDAGACLSTHLGNGAHLNLRRHPNYIWEQLANDRLAASFIADGHHLPASVLTVMVRAKGVERSILISDATELAGMPPGRYETPVGGPVELSADGRLALAGSPLLAGAARPLLDCVAWTARHTDIRLRDALRMATANPARLLGVPGPARGELRVGAAGDVVVFRADPATGRLDVDTTVVRGVIVHRPDQ